MPGEHGAISSKDSYIELEVSVTQKSGAHENYAVGDHVTSVVLGPIDFLSKNK